MFLRSVEQHGHVRKKFDHSLFKGVSVQIRDEENADKTARLMSQSTAVRSMWPVSLHSLPDTKVHWTGNETSSFERKVPANQTGDPFSPHAMTQVDKLRAKGYTGKGIHVAIVDTGVCTFRLAHNRS